MSSIELAHAILPGSDGRRRVSVEWHKGQTYTVTLLQGNDTLVFTTLRTWPCRDMQRAMRKFAAVVLQQWEDGED